MKVETQVFGCYKNRMARLKVKESDKKSETIGVTATPATKRKIVEIATQHERSISWIGGALLARGLALYEKDGRLKDK